MLDIWPGDILIQRKGEPWVTGAKLLFGHPYPHARMVNRVKDGVIYTLENNWYVKETVVANLDDYEVWRPRCSDDIKRAAIAWMDAHRGESYGYFRLAELVVGYRLGMRTRPGMDDDKSQDYRLKVCSEIIAMAYYRSGFDVAPGVQDRDTMPWDLRNDLTMIRLQ